MHMHAHTHTHIHKHLNEFALRELPFLDVIRSRAGECELSRVEAEGADRFFVVG